jgi:hypothetical protein
MSSARFLAAFAVVSLVTSLTFGQTALDKVEAKLKGKAAPAGAPALAAPAAAAEAAKPYLGFVPDEEAKEGVHIIEVSPGGPAELGGLRGGDVITAVDGKPMADLDAFDAFFKTTTVGQRLRLTVDRAGKPQSLTVVLRARSAATEVAGGENPGEAPVETPQTDPAAATRPAASSPTLTDPAGALTDPVEPKPAPIRSKPLEAKPLNLGSPPADPTETDPAIPAPRSLINPATDPATPDPPAAGLAADITADPTPASPAASGRPSLGITVVPLTQEARAAYGLTVSRGAFITNVRPGSPADTAGLPVGGVVVAMDGRRIDTADDLVGLIRAGRVGQEVELSYYEGADFARKTVRLAPAAAGIVGSPPRALTPAVGAADERPLLPAGADRLLDKVERTIDSFAGPRTTNPAAVRGPSTVYDPAEMAALRDNVLKMQETIASLEERIKALEAKLGEAPAAGITP